MYFVALYFNPRQKEIFNITSVKIFCYWYFTDKVELIYLAIV